MHSADVPLFKSSAMFSNEWTGVLSFQEEYQRQSALLINNIGGMRCPADVDLDFWSRCCLLDCSMIKLSFSSFHTLFFGNKSSPHSRNRE